MVEEGVAGAEFVSGVAGAAEGAGVEFVPGAAGVTVLSVADELGGGIGLVRLFVSGAVAAEGEAGASVEFAGPAAVKVAPSTLNFSRSARKRFSIWALEILKYAMKATMKSKTPAARTRERLRSIKG